jgi:hypothetical protein
VRYAFLPLLDSKQPRWCKLEIAVLDHNYELEKSEKFVSPTWHSVANQTEGWTFNFRKIRSVSEAIPVMLR